MRRRAVKTMIKTYGQTPKQLFKTSHPIGQSAAYQGMKGFEKQLTSCKESTKSSVVVRLQLLKSSLEP